MEWWGLLRITADAAQRNHLSLSSPLQATPQAHTKCFWASCPAYRRSHQGKRSYFSIMYHCQRPLDLPPRSFFSLPLPVIQQIFWKIPRRSERRGSEQQTEVSVVSEGRWAACVPPRGMPWEPIREINGAIKKRGHVGMVQLQLLETGGLRGARAVLLQLVSEAEMLLGWPCGMTEAQKASKVSWFHRGTKVGSRDHCFAILVFSKKSLSLMQEGSVSVSFYSSTLCTRMLWFAFIGLFFGVF